VRRCTRLNWIIDVSVGELLDDDVSTRVMIHQAEFREEKSQI
jgi:hypothetical protein